jgi:hypothetical protein
MTNKHDFTGKSIKCDTWEQMLHLAKLAEEQGITKPKNDDYWFSESSFNDKYCYFMVVDSIGYTNDIISETLASKIVTYSDFINTLPTEVVEVTGCGDCPLRSWNDESGVVYCLHKDHQEPTKYNYEDLFTTCPLKKASITIKLKQHETTGN